MRLSKITLFAICTLLFGVLQQTTTNAQSSADYQIHLKNQVLSPEENVDAFISTFDQKNEAFIQDHFFKIVQFNEVPDASVKEILSEAGITLLDYLPVNAYFAAFSNDFNIEILNKADIRSIIDVENSYKLSPMLYEEGYPDYALRPDDKIELLLNYYHVIASSTVVDRIQKYGYEVMLVDHFAHYLHIVIPVSAIDKIAGEACVMYMEPIYPVPEPENYTGRTLHHGNSIASDYSTGRHYDGTGVHIIIQDDGRIGPHIDYEGRIGGQFMGFNSGSHGDHCAGIIMGSGNKDPKGRGNAFGSTLYVYPAAGYEGFSSIPLTYNSYDIRITSTSYGDGCNAGYTTLSRSLDQQSRIYHSLMHVFSTGNSGTSDCGYGAGPGWGNITGGHKAGKNVIAVANLDYIDNLAGSSSRGPAHDGRIKPDLAAKGSSVYSTINPNIYDIYSGTSMACPGTAGTLAQLYQAYREIVGGEPGGGLMKALLLNTAEDLGNPGPDFKFGWGRINALRAVKVIEENRFDTSFIAHGGTKTHVFDVPENTAQMRVMVYWTDFEASVNTNWALVNNLDITVEDPQSSTWNPWVLNHFPHADSLNKNAVRGTDDRNNVEQVTLDYPEAGSYTLTVTGTTIPYGPQVYYIVYEFIPEGVILIYPFGGESFAPGEEETIRWDAFGYDEPFQLEYSLDNGTSWIVISDSLDGAARHYDWDVPITVSGQGLIKITRGNTDSQNEVPFSVMGVPQNVTIDWACSEALHLSWEPVVGAVEYEVMMLGEKYMEPLATTGVTSYIVDDISISQEYWFTVRAIGENGAQGQRAIAVQKSPGTFDCHEVDAMIESVPFADWGVFQSCMDISDLSISVKIKNFGLEPIENPDLSFQLDGGAVVTETCSMIIAPDSTYYYDFDEQIDISEIGNHILKVWIDYAPDQNPDNDLLEISLEVIEGNSVVPGDIQTFDSWDECVAISICELYDCPLYDGWINLENEVHDDIDWRTYDGSTTTSGTGPSFDHTTGTDEGNYLYVEPSGSCFYKEATLMAPCIDLTNVVSPVLKMWYHAYGSAIGWFHVDVFGDSEVVFDVIEPIVGNQGDEWKELNIDLSPWSGQVIGLRFRGITGGGEKGDFAIDDIAITDVTTVRNNLTENDKLSVFPNPSSGLVNVSVTDAGTDRCQFKVFDMYGREIMIGYVAPIDGRINISFDLSEYSNGLYIIEVKSGNGTYQAKLTKR